jgi:hypothetical protein
MREHRTVNDLGVSITGREHRHHGTSLDTDLASRSLLDAREVRKEGVL